MNQLFNTPFFHTAILFLSMVSAQLSAQLRADLQSGNSTLDDQVLEVKKEISGGGIIDLIDATTNRVDGICSFDKNRLQTGRAFVFDEISIKYATDANSGKEGSLIYDTDCPAELQNAIFIINQNGREVLRMPVIDIHNIGTGLKVSDGYTTLKSLRYLVDDAQINLQIKFPTGVALGAGSKHYVHLRLRGVQTTKKVNA